MNFEENRMNLREELEMEKHKLKSAIENCYCKLGEIFLEKYQDAATGEDIQYIERITRLQDKLATLNDRLEELKNVLFCPICCGQVPANSNFCNLCGAKLEKNSSDNETNERSHTQNIREICPKCGKSVGMQYDFCIHCGEIIL